MMIYKVNNIFDESKTLSLEFVDSQLDDEVISELSEKGIHFSDFIDKDPNTIYVDISHISDKSRDIFTSETFKSLIDLIKCIVRENKIDNIIK